ncbi:MAG TPA: energy-coupling factor transporter transmembrane component T [Negativicutes bacterium]|jgi:energy-coupling factor transport system permease protein
MNNTAPLTKLILTAAVSVWAMLIQSLTGLGGLVIVQLLLIVLSGVAKKTSKAVGSLLFFALLLVGMQYALGSGLEAAVASGLRMVAMTLVFVILLATTRIQDLTAALVSQCRIPHEYAFMFTAALRFIPDFLEESKAVQEAQACRGYAPRGNLIKRLIAYLAIVEPLVLKAVSRSETMAMSLELRGFGCRSRCSFSANVALAARDYLMLGGMAVVTVGCLVVKFSML